MKKFLIIDTFNFFHRAYYALPPSLTTPDGTQVNAVYGVASMLLSIFDLISPDYVVAALESKEKVNRKKQFEEYKAHRKPMDDELKSQIPLLFELLEGFGIKTLSVSGYEADDIIGTLVDKFKNDVQVVISSNDRDLWQLIGDGVLVMAPENGGKKAAWIDALAVKAKFGFGPDFVVDYKALTGDPSDNIPGVYGIGKVIATKLIGNYGHLDNIYDHLDDFKGSVRKKLSEGKDSAFLSYDLATIVTDLELDVSLDDCALSGLDKTAATAVLERFAFHSLVNRLNKRNGSSKDGYNRSSDGKNRNAPSIADSKTSGDTQLDLF